jgi:cytochrome-b5 reductase
VVKRYPGGEFSEAFHALRPGVDAMQFRGPITTLHYTANGPCQVLGLVGGGTGITPLYQLIRTVLHNPQVVGTRSSVGVSSGGGGGGGRERS